MNQLVEIYLKVALSRAKEHRLLVMDRARSSFVRQS